jgi:hypothetical protein
VTRKFVNPAVLGLCCLLSACGGNALLVAGVASAAVATYTIYQQDGLIWEVEDEPVARDTWRITVRKSRFSASGDGEAKEFFRRRAQQIAYEKDCHGYQVLEQTESLESAFPGVQRVLRGRIFCNRAPAEEKERSLG